MYALNKYLENLLDLTSGVESSAPFFYFNNEIISINTDSSFKYIRLRETKELKFRKDEKKGISQDTLDQSITMLNEFKEFNYKFDVGTFKDFVRLNYIIDIEETESTLILKAIPYTTLEASSEITGVKINLSSSFCYAFLKEDSVVLELNKITPEELLNVKHCISVLDNVNIQELCEVELESITNGKDSSVSVQGQTIFLMKKIIPKTSKGTKVEFGLLQLPDMPLKGVFNAWLIKNKVSYKNMEIEQLGKALIF